MGSLKKIVGVLALQGDFEKHEARVCSLGASTLRIKQAEQLEFVDALVIPGGESTTLLRLMDDAFLLALQKKIHSGLPTFATCAGLILLANTVSAPSQDSLGLLNVAVERNAYGRQINSFIDPSLCWTESGTQYLNEALPDYQPKPLEGVFIRAPKLRLLGDDVEVLLTRQFEPVCVKQGSILAASFHPELSKESTLHRLFLSLA